MRFRFVGRLNRVETQTDEENAESADLFHFPSTAVLVCSESMLRVTLHRSKISFSSCSSRLIWKMQVHINQPNIHTAAFASSSSSPASSTSTSTSTVPSSTASAPSTWQPRRRGGPQQHHPVNQQQQLQMYQDRINQQWQAQQLHLQQCAHHHPHQHHHPVPMSNLDQSLDFIPLSSAYPPLHIRTTHPIPKFTLRPESQESIDRLARHHTLQQQQVKNHHHHGKQNQHQQRPNHRQQHFTKATPHQQPHQQQQHQPHIRPFHSSFTAHAAHSSSSHSSPTTTDREPPSKRRRLPHFLAHQDADDEEQMETMTANGAINVGGGSNHTNSSAAQNVKMMRSNSMPLTSGGHMECAQQLAHHIGNATQPTRAHSSTAPHHHQSHHPNNQHFPNHHNLHAHHQPATHHQHPPPHPHVTYMPEPPRVNLPPGFTIQYIRTRAESDRAAAELLSMLTAEAKSHVAPSTSQHLHIDAQCSCPPVHIGFDVEWRPTFVKGQPQNPVALIQLSTQTQAWLFQVTNWTRQVMAALPPLSGTVSEGKDGSTSASTTDTSRSRPFNNVTELRALQQIRARTILGDSLCSLLSDPRFLKVGVGVKGDVSKLYVDYGVQMKGVIDLSEYANERAKEVVEAAAEARKQASQAAAAAAAAVAEAAAAESVEATSAVSVSHATITSSNDFGSSSSVTGAAELSSSIRSTTGVSSPSISSSIVAFTSSVSSSSSSSSLSLTSSSISSSVPASSSPSLPCVPPQNWSLASLVTYSLDGVTLPKPKKIRLSNWEQILSPSAQEYAALDAYVGWAVYQRLHQTHVKERNCENALNAGMRDGGKKKVKEYVQIEVTVNAKKRTGKNSASTIESSSSSLTETTMMIDDEQISATAAAVRIDSQSDDDPSLSDLVDQEFLISDTNITSVTQPLQTPLVAHHSNPVTSSNSHLPIPASNHTSVLPLTSSSSSPSPSSDSSSSSPSVSG